MNNVIIKGRLTSDIELKCTSSGVEYCTGNIAVDRRTAKDKDKITDFIPFKAWRQTAVFLGTYFAKGQEILINGNVYFDKYEKDGENRTFAYVNVNNVEFCGSKSANAQQTSQPAPQPSANDINSPSDIDSDLPF